MEHRWSIRKPIALEVLVFNGGDPGIACLAYNIGMEGMFIGTGPLPVARNSILEIEFALNDKSGQSVNYRIPVFVRHVSNGGIGIMFRNFHQRLYQSLHALLYESTEYPLPVSVGSGMRRSA